MKTNEWNELLEFETKDLVEQYFKEKHSREPNAQKIHEITSSFIQGRAYFKSALDSDFSVRPLLQYYGILSLSKALILSLSPHISESQLKPSHGLSVKNWSEVLKSRNYSELEIEINEGSFYDLISVTKNTNLLRANSSHVNWSNKLSTPKTLDTIKLKELIQYFPDLAREYKTWTGEPLNYALLSSIQLDTNLKRCKVVIQRELSEELLNELFPIDFCKNRHINKCEISFDDCNWGPNITQLWHSGFQIIGDACIIPGLKNDTGLNQLSAMYAISYVFGMMARYYPTSWISLRRVEKGDRIYPFAQRVLDFISVKYPIIILDFLRNKKELI